MCYHEASFQSNPLGCTVDSAHDIPTSMLVPRFVGGGRIETAEKPVPEPGLAQLLIRVSANALCRLGARPIPAR